MILNANQIPLKISKDKDIISIDDFIISNSNKNAFELIKKWPYWNDPKMFLISGVNGSGKTTLCRLLGEKSGAHYIKAKEVTKDKIPELFEDGLLIIDDIENFVSYPRLLFHIINWALETKSQLLLTSCLLPQEIGFQLADLNSRLKAIPVVNIEAPDDELLTSVFCTQFKSRQLNIDDNLIDFLLMRMERSIPKAIELVKRLDHYSLATKKKITRKFAKEVLPELSIQNVISDDDENQLKLM